MAAKAKLIQTPQIIPSVRAIPTSQKTSSTRPTTSPQKTSSKVKAKAKPSNTKRPKRKKAPTSVKAKAPSKRKIKKILVKKTGVAKKAKIPWIPLGFAGVLGIASGIFWGISSKGFKDSRDKNRAQVEAFQDYREAKSHRSTATFLLVGGGVALGLAGLFYLWPSSPLLGIRKGSKYYDDSPIIGFTREFR